MKILEFHAENVKRLRVVTIKPDSAVVEIAGDNEQGKTSVLDSILWLLAGTDKVQWEPVRKGEEQALIVATIGEDRMQFRVSRVFQAGRGGEKFTSTLRIEDAGGRTIKGPQTLLDQMAAPIAFDPLDFAQAKPKERIKLLQSVISGVDFDHLAKRRQKAYEDRRDAARDAKALRARADGIVTDPSQHTVPVDKAALLAALQAAADAAQALDREEARRDQVRQQRDRRREEANRLAAEIKEMTKLRDAATAEAERLDAGLDVLPELGKVQNTDDIRGRIMAADMINEQVRRRSDKATLVEEAEAKEAEAEGFTRAIERIDATVAKAIEKADLPIKGLALSDDDVTLDGVPFGQASDARQLRAGIAIAMASNPRLKVIRIRNGGVLDKNAFETLTEVATETGFQVWLESVEPHSTAAVIMEDGGVKAP
jgi:recombinational DNA repair ATPase RecF